MEAKNKFATTKIVKQYQIAKADDVLADLGVTENGLNRIEIAEHQAKYGFNEVFQQERMSLVLKFLVRLKSPLIIILLVIGITSILVGDMRSAIVIFAMILLSAVTDFVQEHKSEKIVEKLKEQVVTKIEVIRDNKKEMIRARELTVGDIVCLSVGSIVPADGRLIAADDLFLNESSLTGEAFPVEKNSQPLLATTTDIGAQKNMVFSGTNVSSGYGKMVVLAIGAETVFGRIAAKLAEPNEETEFEKGVRGFGNLIVKVIIALVVMIFFINTGLTHHNWIDSLMFSLALAVGLTPELLPMIVSITLARGSQNMAKHGVIVKRLNSIHDFGGMDVLCTDKTGTLTKNRIELVKHIDLTGRDSVKLLDYTYLNSYFQSGINNPLDSAVLKIKERQEITDWVKIDETPFDFIRRRLSIILEHDEKCCLISKGAPEELFAVCGYYEDADGKRKFDKKLQAQATAKYNELSADGFRVLALGYRQVVKKTEYEVIDESELILLGLVAFLDPPKASTGKAISKLEDQGIEIKIITGDNDLVTVKICKELKINVKGVLTGVQMAEMTAEQLAVAVEQSTIFARMSPEQKGQIVSALRVNGHSVGYLGDGINDALPLKAADVGISVNNAVDVAKEAADLILLTKDLQVLSLGVTEGRRTFGNTIKYILMGLSSNFGNMFSVAAASFVLPFLPMKPLQILLNNFLYDFSQVTIPLDDVDDEYLKKPKRWDLKFIQRFMLTFGPISSLFDLTTFGVMLWLFKANEAAFQTAWFMESFATQTLVIFIIRTRRIPFWRSKPNKYLVVTIFTFLAIAMIIPFSPLADYFGFAAPDLGVLAVVWGIVIVYLAVVEFMKRAIYRKYLS